MLEYRGRTEWWRYVLSYAYSIIIFPIMVVLIIPYFILQYIIRFLVGFGVYFCNPEEKRSLKEDMKLALTGDFL